MHSCCTAIWTGSCFRDVMGLHACEYLLIGTSSTSGFNLFTSYTDWSFCILLSEISPTMNLLAVRDSSSAGSNLHLEEASTYRVYDVERPSPAISSNRWAFSGIFMVLQCWRVVASFPCDCPRDWLLCQHDVHLCSTQS